MSNPGVIYLTKYKRDSFYFAVEDNIGEAIHIHYADSYINIRLDLTIREFFDLASDVEEALDVLLDGKAKCSDFDPVFLSDLAYDSLINTERITYDSVMLENLMVDYVLPDGKTLYLPITEARLAKAFRGDHSENDKRLQTNYFLPTGKVSSNRDRISQIFQYIKENNGFTEKDFVWLYEDTNHIWDGHHRAMSLYILKGNCPVPVRRIWFRKTNVVEYQPTMEEKVNQLSSEINRLREEERVIHSRIDEEGRILREEINSLQGEISGLHEEINRKTSLRHFAGNIKRFIRKRLFNK